MDVDEVVIGTRKMREKEVMCERQGGLVSKQYPQSNKNNLD